MDISQLAGTDYREFTLDGRLFRAGELMLREWAPLQAWIKANSPRPTSALRSEDLAGLSEADRRAILKIALDESRAWPPAVGSRAWFVAIDAPGGAAMLLHTLLAKHQPGLTLGECEALAERSSILDVLPIMGHAMGIDDAPKSPAPVGAKPKRARGRRRG